MMGRTADHLAEHPVALVTGAAGGIGRAISRMLTQRGFLCVLVDIDRANLDEFAATLGGPHLSIVTDLADNAALERLIEEVEARCGRLDLLVNNAVMLGLGNFEERSPAGIAAELQVNLVSPILLTRLAIPLLQRAPAGQVVNIVSLGGIFPLPETTVYSASKFGLRGAMLCLGLDGPRLGIKVGSVLPSATETPALIREAVEGGNTLQFMDPPQRPEDVARQVAALLDRTVLERFPKRSESLTVRLAMLAPNHLPRIIPKLAGKGVRGHAKYLRSLEERGIARRTPDGGWELTGVGGVTRSVLSAPKREVAPGAELVR